MKRTLRLHLACASAVYLCALAYWSGAESVMPGQQYPSPWLPCTHIAVIGGPALALAIAYTNLIRQWRTEKRQKRKDQP